MCVIAPRTNRKRKIAVTGASRVVVGTPPAPALGSL